MCYANKKGVPHGETTQSRHPRKAPRPSCRLCTLAWGGKLDSSPLARVHRDRKSTRLNSSHDQISYAVFCLKKKKTDNAKPTDAHNVHDIPMAQALRVHVARDPPDSILLLHIRAQARPPHAHHARQLPPYI